MCLILVCTSDSFYGSDKRRFEQCVVHRRNIIYYMDPSGNRTLKPVDKCSYGRGKIIETFFFFFPSRTTEIRGGRERGWGCVWRRKGSQTDGISSSACSPIAGCSTDTVFGLLNTSSSRRTLRELIRLRESSKYLFTRRRNRTAPRNRPKYVITPWQRVIPSPAN